jgi:Fe-S cluster assembly protein SufB
MAARDTTDQVLELERYKHGFVSDIDQEFAPKGLSEAIVRFISAKKAEPDWMLQWRLEAYRRWLELDEPDWARVNFPKID